MHYEVKSAPSPTDEDGALIIEYPATGRFDTSTPASESGGLFRRGYYRRTPEGLMPLSRAGDIWGEFTHLTFPDDGSGTAGRASGFFVGTVAAFRATEWPVEHRRPVGIEEK